MTYGLSGIPRYWLSHHVDLYEGGRTAIVEAIDTELDNRVQRLRVDLPYNARADLLRNANVNFDAHPIRNDGAIWGLLQSNFLDSVDWWAILLPSLQQHLGGQVK